MLFYALNNGLYIISFHTLQTCLVLFVFQHSFLLHSRTRRDCDIWYCKKWMVCGNHFASIFYHYKQGMPIIHLLSPTCLTTFYNGRSISRCLIFCMHGHPFFMINWNYVYKICFSFPIKRFPCFSLGCFAMDLATTFACGKTE